MTLTSRASHLPHDAPHPAVPRDIDLPGSLLVVEQLRRLVQPVARRLEVVAVRQGQASRLGLLALVAAFAPGAERRDRIDLVHANRQADLR